MQTSLRNKPYSSVNILRMENYEAKLEAPATEYTVTELSCKKMKLHCGRDGNSPPTLSEAELRSIVEAGGGRYVGVMNEIPGKMESIVLFTSPQTRSTLGLPSSLLTVATVREQLADSDAAFNQTRSK